MRLSVIAIILLSFVGCQREPAVTPSPAKPLYTLPQGNSAADGIIMSFYQKYQSYILYRFTQQDYSYDYTDKRPDSAFHANPKYVDTALGFFRNQLVTLYPEAFLRKTMPYTVLLAAYIGAKDTRSPTGFASTSNALTIGWADSTIMQWSPADLKRNRASLHRFYWERAIRSASIEMPPAFLEMAGAVVYGNLYTREARLEEGVVSTALTMNITEDFLSYIDLIAGNSLAELEAGLFQPGIDKKGLIRKRYNAIADYYRIAYGFDLKTFGMLP